jgi:hypothetical protein
MPRTYDEELKFIERINNHCWRIKKGFVPNMNVCIKREIFIVKHYLKLFTG